jgi:hypothetical protein
VAVDSTVAGVVVEGGGDVSVGLGDGVTGGDGDGVGGGVASLSVTDLVLESVAPVGLVTVSVTV